METILEETRTWISNDDLYSAYFWHYKPSLIITVEFDLSVEDTRQLATFLNDAADILEKFINDNATSHST